MSPETVDQLLAGITSLTWQSLVMFAVAGILLYLAIVREYEPLLLLRSRPGAPRQPAPLADDRRGGAPHAPVRRGIENELFPLLIFIGIGAIPTSAPCWRTRG